MVARRTDAAKWLNRCHDAIASTLEAFFDRAVQYFEAEANQPQVSNDNEATKRAAPSGGPVVAELMRFDEHGQPYRVVRCFASLNDAGAWLTQNGGIDPSSI